MQKMYSFYGTELTLLLDERTADAYNRVAAEFRAAQLRYKEKTGSDWTPNLPLELNVEKQDLETWNAMAGVLEALNEFNKFHPVDYGELTEGCLVPV